jgi:hypothetical protein
MDGTPRFNVTEQPQVIYKGRRVAYHVSITENNHVNAEIQSGLAVSKAFEAGMETQKAIDGAASRRGLRMECVTRP